MIYKDKLKEKAKIISPEMDKLLGLAWDKQPHFGDLLLINVNGFYEAEIVEYNSHSKENRNPLVIGPGSEGLSEQTHYKFIHNYRTSHIHTMTYQEYKEQFVMEKWDKEISEWNAKLIESEELTIQLEMLIYLKFWESDMIIKKLYQLARALNGEPYDWYFKVQESSRDQNCTGKRQDIIRKLIRDKIKTYSPVLFQIIKDTYKTQIRNSIAHSNYSFLGRQIHLNNYVKDDAHSQLTAISFDEWTDIFHNTIVLHNELLRMNNSINDHFAEIANKHENTMEILVTEKSGEQYCRYLEYRNEWRDWTFKRSKNRIR
jgi:hypothetical protein